MARYIDADNLINELSAACMPIYEKGITGILGDNSSIADIINEQPTADVQEVVRCKDCRHATFYSCKNDACYKRIICEYEIGTDDEDFYCVYGEARTPKRGEDK